MKSNELCKALVHPNFILIIVLLIGGFGCKKFIAIDPPSNQVISSAVFTDDKTATSAVVGLYSQMMNSNLFLVNGGISLYAGLSADEIKNSVSSTAIDPFTANAIPSTNTLLQNSLWRWGYSYIYQANAVIEGLDSSSLLSTSVKKQLMGEMKLTRAFLFFCLTNLFGDIPLTLGTDYRINEKLARTSTSHIYSQIIADLKEAQTELSFTDQKTGAGRPNAFAATALLSRVHLYQKDWKNAEIEAEKVIASKEFVLSQNLNSVFLADSKEVIWSFAPVNTFNTAEGATFLPSSTNVRPPFYLIDPLVNAFEVGDLRKSIWVGKNIISNVTYCYPSKYKIRNGVIKTEYNVILRLAEQYLIRAEARIQQGKIQQAIEDINIIRSRARAVPSVSVPNPLPELDVNLSSQEALLAVEHERRIELFAEFGHRWFDLRRTGRIDVILTASKINWTSTAALFPIPFIEIQRNHALTQNPGYQQ